MHDNRRHQPAHWVAGDPMINDSLSFKPYDLLTEGELVEKMGHATDVIAFSSLSTMLATVCTVDDVIERMTTPQH